MYKTIDLFAGAGGLSLGFKQTGKFQILAAFEINPDMRQTYQKNHKGTDVFEDVKQADYAMLQKRYGQIDVVIGGPPCQGFSNANRQKNHLISQNNMLVREYVRAIIELRPKAFVMENVRMLQSKVHRFYKSRNDEDLILKYHLPVEERKISLLHKAESDLFFDGVEKIVQDQELIVKLTWPDSAFSVMNIIHKYVKNIPKMEKALQKHKKELLKAADSINCSGANRIDEAGRNVFIAVKKWFAGTISVEEFKAAVRPAVIYQKMLRTAKEIFNGQLLIKKYDATEGLHAIVDTFSVCDYIKNVMESEELGYEIRSSVLCAADFGVPQKRERFIVMGVRKDISSNFELPKAQLQPQNYYTVRDAIEDLENVPVVTDRLEDYGTPLPNITPKSELARRLRDSHLLLNHMVTKTRAVAMERFKALLPGQNFHNLDNNLKSTYTDASRTQNTIYLRLEYDKPSGTVVNVRKSMWIHPTLNRAVSVREAARLQSFPDSFIFCGTKDKQYQQVGNAVPPLMAQAIADDVAGVLDAYGAKVKNG